MMRRTYVLAALALATLLPACGELSRTEIMVVVEADEGVQLDASSLRFQVWGRRSDVPVFGDPLFDDRFESIAFPRRFGVVPDGNDASRFIRVQATAVDATGAEFVTQSAITGFVVGETRLLTLRLTTDCRDVSCDEPGDRTCKAGTCEDNLVDATLLPPVNETADAGSLRDGGMDGDVPSDGGVDSSVVDSSVVDSSVRDSGVDSGVLDSGVDSGVDSGSPDSGIPDSGIADSSADASADAG